MNAVACPACGLLVSPGVQRKGRVAPIPKHQGDTVAMDSMIAAPAGRGDAVCPGSGQVGYVIRTGAMTPELV